MDWYKEDDIHVIGKTLNPPNCPDFRSIEKYWAIVTSKLKKSARTIKKTVDLQRWWNKMADRVDSFTVQKMMGGIKQKVREFIRHTDE